MALIDIGSPAIDRPGDSSNGFTLICQDNPANESGRITQIEVWAGQNLVGLEVATFFLESGNNYSTRDTHTIGAVTSGSKQTFPGLDITVETGDYIGFYFSGGTMNYDDSTGSPAYGISSDQIPCTDVTFALWYNTVMYSCYGTGTTEAPPTAKKKNVIFMGSNF